MTDLLSKLDAVANCNPAGPNPAETARQAAKWIRDMCALSEKEVEASMSEAEDYRAEITRLRAELDRVREAGRAVVQCYSTGDMTGYRRAFTALDAAIKEGGA